MLKTLLSPLFLLLLSLLIYATDIPLARRDESIPPVQPGQVVEGYILEEFISQIGTENIQKSIYWTSLLSNSEQVIGKQADMDEAEAVSTNYKVPEAEECFDGYCKDEYIFHGGHGDVWKAKRIDDHGNIIRDESYVLKRMLIHHENIKLCALREIYFGQHLQHHEAFPRFVTYFTTPLEYWLVFRDEGSSLQSYLYNIDKSTNSKSTLLKPSNAWRRMRKSELGISSMKSILYQLITNAAELHSLGIVHRDLKPSNILLNVETRPRLLISDFSSAINDVALSNAIDGTSLYENEGPSIQEETLDYAPPEVRLFATVTESTTRTNVSQPIAYDEQRPESYDIWSIGIIFLEMILGTVVVFTIDQRTEAMITQLLQKKGITDRQQIQNAIYLSALADYCIYDR
jgi:serine/threonine protein kinase